jgi:hypothetical protein
MSIRRAPADQMALREQIIQRNLHQVLTGTPRGHPRARTATVPIAND